MGLGALALIDEVASVGPVKHIRVSVVGDSAYPSGGSIGFLAGLRTLLGEDVEVVHVAGSGVNKDGATAVEFEYTPRPKGVAITSITTASDLFSTAAALHGLSSGDAVRFFRKSSHNANNPDPKLPAAITENTVYYVIASGLTTTAFKVSATSGGSAVDIADVGAGDFVVVKEDKLLVRQKTDGVESADSDQSDTTYNLYVVAK